MARLALVAPAWALRETLVLVADSGVLEIDHTISPADLPLNQAALALQRLAPDRPVTPRLVRAEPALRDLERDGRAQLLAGEAQLREYTSQAVRRDDITAYVGWAPERQVPQLSARLAEVGAALVPLPLPRGVEPPTAVRPGVARATFSPLVTTYATPPYVDVDPTVLAGLSYAVMFGAMFGDAGHGALLLLGAALLRLGRPRRFAALRPHWLLVAAAGACATAFGLAYGEFFGPTGAVPVVWLTPVEHPIHLLVAGAGLGAVLLAGAYVLGIVNRIREAGLVGALFVASGVAGALLFLAAGLGAAAWYVHLGWLAAVAVVVALLGLLLAFVGLLATAGRGAAGVVQASIELLDIVIRLGANVASFARLGAFGLTHAVVGWIVWDLSVGMWRRGPAGMVAAVVVFVIGNALALGLEALVAAVQALRLEYYELFSRVFQTEGRPFRPWHVPTVTATERAGPALNTPTSTVE
ncbi:MAG: ATPase [Actinobacteria bacterium]|nr:ATPase [Actinomycetota bacterium]